LPIAEGLAMRNDVRTWVAVCFAAVVTSFAACVAVVVWRLR